jgi:hypothetical protein
MSWYARIVRGVCLCALVVTPALIGCSGKPDSKPEPKPDPKPEARVTKENFGKIKKEMSRKEVEEILGKGETRAGLKIGETSGDGVVYTGDKGKGEVIYKDDKVLASHWADKSEPKNEPKVTKENFDKVKKDMSRKEVEDVLGKGETKTALKIGETSGDGVVYTGDKGKGEIIFKDDKVVVGLWTDNK